MHSFLFPGQGSQQPAMGAPFVGTDSWELVTEASDICGRDVGHLLIDAPAEELVQTRNAQLGTFMQSMLVLDAARRAGLSADAFAGHSLGEFSALCAAGVLRFADAVTLVHERGEAMQVCITERTGTMAAVLGMDEDQLAEVCDATGGEVWLANTNAPGQIVIAGDPAAVDAAGAAAKDAGAKRVMPLDVSGAFHTPFMAPAADRLGAAIDSVSFGDPTGPVVANVDAAVHTDAVEWPGLLRRQLTSPVRWAASMSTLIDEGVTVFVELGPGAVLTGTVKRIDKTPARHNIASPDDVVAVAAALGTTS